MDLGLGLGMRTILFLGKVYYGIVAILNNMLFGNGEVGAFYDVTDLDTVFQDTAGTTPADYGLKVGLVLDKSKGLVLGPELVTNGGFDSDTAWTKGTGWTISGGVAVATAAPAANPGFSQSGVFPAASTVYYSFTISDYISGAVALRCYGSGGNEVVSIASANGTYEGYYFTRSDATGLIGFSVVSSTALKIDNISVRELPGLHAPQANDALRPTLGRAPIAGRRNLLTYTEQFDNAVWVKANSGAGTAPIVTPNYAANPIGAMTATRLQANSGGSTSSDFSLVQQITTGFTGAHIAALWVKSNTGLSQDIYFRYDEFDSTSSTTVTTEWQRVTYLQAAAINNDYFTVGSRGSANGNVSVDILIWGAQLEPGSTATAYQRVGSQYDITEAGVASPAYLRLDLSDDKMTTTFPAGFTGDVMLFGRKGSWIEQGITIAPAGVLDIGPTTITGGTAGVMAAIGDVVGWMPVGKTLTAQEQAYLVAYYRERGALGLLTPGPELVTNGTFDTDASGWDSRSTGTGTFAVSGGAAQIVGTDGSNRGWFTQTLALLSGSPYKISIGATVTSGNGVMIFGTATGSGQIALNSSGVFTQIVPAGGATLYVGGQTGSGGGNLSLDNISVRLLTPELS